jgi:hypothetical protein
MTLQEKDASGERRFRREAGYSVVPAKPTGPAFGRPDDRLSASRDPYSAAAVVGKERITSSSRNN